MDQAIKTLKESEIDKLATPWACVRKSTLLHAATTRVAAVRADVTMKPIDVTGYEENPYVYWHQRWWNLLRHWW